MTDLIPSALELATIDELVEELGKRFGADNSAMVFAACAPDARGGKDGTARFFIRASQEDPLHFLIHNLIVAVQQKINDEP